METADPPSYAAWGRRLAAIAIDLILVSIAPFVLAVVVFATAGAGGDDDLYASLDRFVVGVLLAGVLSVVLSTLYFTMLVARTGQTVGKKLVGIAVRDARDVARRIGYGRALARWGVLVVLWLLYSIPGVIDALWPLWDKRKQSWHDKAARSVVVRV